jgi:apolipoprotein D and lipocalin family protein
MVQADAQIRSIRSVGSDSDSVNSFEATSPSALGPSDQTPEVRQTAPLPEEPSMRTEVGVRIACLDLLSGCHGEPLEVVDVDLSRFQGRWYEIAKLPHTKGTPARRKAVRELRANGRQLTESSRSGRKSDSSPRVISGAVMVSNSGTAAKLSVDSGDFCADGWIIELDADYRFAVIGHPTRRYLWIISRSPSMARSTLASLLDRTRAKGFDLSHLQFSGAHLGRSAA